ncbi:MAG: aryl-sulfate sulfotransferase [Myxococcales bacterium]|nr:aryl-sulfate sulfotransferase [Myxococcales bacterium]
MRGWMVALAVAGCHGGSGGTADDPLPTDQPPTETGTPTDSDTATTPTTAHTGTTVESGIALACAPTDNALRFACHVTVEPPAEVELAFGRSDGTGTVRVHPGEGVAAEHDIATWFMAPETTYDVEARLLGAAPGSGAVTQVTTTAPPSAVSARITVSGTSSTPYVGTSLPCTSGVAVAAVFDTTTGEQVWYQVMDGNGTFGGFNMLQFTEDRTILGQTGDTIVEVTPAGTELLNKPYTDDFHHDLFRRHGKTWILFRENVGGVQLDGFVVWDADGNELSRWREADAFTVPVDARGDWSHTNTVWVDEDESVILSLYTQHTVLRVSPAGEVLWVMDTVGTGGLGNDYVVDWTAVDGADTFSRQHATTFRPDGRLQMLDNEHGRGLILSLDEVAHTARVDASFSAGQSTCGPQGTTVDTAAGHTLVGCSGPALREYDTGPDPVFSSSLVCDNGGGGGGGPGPSGSVRWYPLDGW